MMAPGQLSLLRPPALELTERGRNVPPHVLGVYSVLLAHVRELRCGGCVAGVRRRKRRSYSRGWSNSEVLKRLGIDRRHFRMLERCGLITWTDAGDLVVARYHRSSEWREEQEEARLRRQARQAGIKSGQARRQRREHLKNSGGSTLVPPADLPEIRLLLSNVSAYLERTAVRTPLTADPDGGLIDLPSKRNPGVPSEGTQSGQTPSNRSPLWAPSVLKRVAPASTATLAHRQLRRKVGPAPAPPGPARLPARTAPIPRDVRGSPGPRPETSNRGGARGPDYPTWYDQFRRLGGRGIKREAAETLWSALEQSPAERRRCWTFTEAESRRWRGACRPPNTLAFLQVWHRRLEMERVEQTRNDHPHAGGDLIAGVYSKLKRRGSR